MPLLTRYGVDVVPVVGPGRAISDWLRERGVDDFIHTPHFPGGWAKPRGIEKGALPYRYVRCGWELRKQLIELVGRYGIDLIYASLPFSWIVATPVARAFGIPIVWRAGGVEVTTLEKLALLGFTRFYRPDRMICPADKIGRLFGPLIDAPVEVIVNGVDASQFHPEAGDPGRFSREGASLVVGLAARLVPQKRLEDLIAAAGRISRRRRDVLFLVAGEGSRRAEYEQMAREAGADRMRFVGYVGDMPSFYRACDVVVLPSRSEGCPNVVLEAMAMRKVVVASDAAVTDNVLLHGREGLVYPVGDVDALEADLLRLADEPSMRSALARQAYAHVNDELTAEACSRKLAEAMHEDVELSLLRAAQRASRLPPAPLIEAAPASGKVSLVSPPEP